MFETFKALLPASVLIVAALICFIGGTTKWSKLVWGPFSLVSLAISAVTLCLLPRMLLEPLSPEVPNLVVVDGLSRIFQFLALIIGTLFAAMAFRQQADESTAPEFYGLLLTLIAGLMVVSGANDIVLLFLGLELISVPTYVLIYLGRRDFRCQEAAAKYFLLSILSAAVLLYGLSFLYGLTGSTNLTTMRTILQQTYNGGLAGAQTAAASRMGVVALVLIMAGLGFKLAAVPFHFYAPDVYEGTSSWNAGLLSIIPKAAGLIALIRFVSYTMVGYEEYGQSVALILALATMTVGNIMALLQTNVRRMLAYSGVAHAGYMLVGIAVGFWDSWNPSFRLNPVFGIPVGIQAALFYLIAYSIVSAGLFAVLVYLARPGKEVEHIEDLTGLWKTQPWVAISSAIFLFSLAGIPPLPGFWGKLALFGGALSVRGDFSGAIPYPNTSFVVLAIVGMINAAIAGVYYLRLIALMFLHDPLSTPQPRGGRPAMAAITLCALVTVLLGLQSRPVLTLLRDIEQPVVVEVAKTPVAAPVLSSN